MVMETVSTAVTLVAFPVLRSVAGWAENALSDGKVTKFEWLQLLQTVVRVGLLQAAIYYGAAGWGVDLNVISAGASAVLVDWVARTSTRKKK